jgi:hypothetical protein
LFIMVYKKWLSLGLGKILFILNYLKVHNLLFWLTFF